MIEALHIENFQSLQVLDVELGRFTVLVGPSNSGKSAIRRAIEALVHNEPVAGRLRHDCPAYVVTMKVDGVEVSIHKGKKATSYQVGGQLIEKPGSSCPPAVLEALRLSETNFASQFDPPFLLAETPSAAARALGDLTNISVLFEGIREATRRQRAAGAKAKLHVEQVDILAEKLAVYSDLADEHAVLDNASARMIEAAEAAGHASRVKQAMGAAGAAAEALRDAQAVLATQPDWDYLEGTTAAVETTLAELGMIRGALQRAAHIEAARDSALDELQEVKGLDIDFEALAATLQRAADLGVALTQARQLSHDLAAASAAVYATPAETAAEEELASETICPLCGQALESA